MDRIVICWQTALQLHFWSYDGENAYEAGLFHLNDLDMGPQKFGFMVIPASEIDQ